MPRSRRPTGIALLWLWTFAALCCVLLPRAAMAQSAFCSGSLNDCDGDGIKNVDDPCPAPISGNPDASIRHGFRDVACYAQVVNVLSTGSGCTPVAVRPFERDVPVDPTDPSSAVKHRVGFTWIGVLNPNGAVGSNVLAIRNDAATPPDVEASFRNATPGAEPVPNALFACMQSVEIQDVPLGTAGQPAFKAYSTVQGFRIVAGYVRGIVEAANTATSIGYPSSDPTKFQDALGLITDPCAAASGGTCWLRGLVGTNGTLEDDQQDWDVDDADPVIIDPPDADLPTDINKVYDADCMKKKILQKIVNSLVQTKPAGWPGPPQPDPIAALQEVTTPFGLPAVAFTGPGMSLPAGAQPFGDVEKVEYLTPAMVPTVNAGDLYVPVASDCSVPTDTPNFMFPIDKGYNYPTVNQASTHRHLSGWKQFMGGRDAPRPYAPGVTAFYAAHAHKANPEVDPDFSFNLLQPRPPTPPPFRDAISNSALLMSQISSTTQPPYVVVETGHALWGILEELNWSDHVTPLAAPWLHDSGGQRTLGIYHLASYIDSQTYDYAHDKWTQSYTEYGGQGDYAEITAPVAWFSGDGKNTDQARVSVHVTGDKWHPADDQWLTNGKNTICPTLADQLPWFPMNPNYGAVNGFCQDYQAIQKIAELNDFSQRTTFCDYMHYSPAYGDMHWRLLRERTAFAALWGQLPLQKRPTAKFPPSDLVLAGMMVSNHLHEGSDINWKFNSDSIQTTDLMGDYGNKVCWSQVVPPGLDPIQVATSCSDPGYALCGGDAAGGKCCDPVKRYWKEYGNEVESACKCGSGTVCGPLKPLCDVVACTANFILNCAPVAIAGGVAFVYKTASAYESDVCLLLAGKACSPDGYSLCSDNPDKHGDDEMENELEYNLAYGAQVNKVGRTSAPYPGDCNASTVIPNSCKFPDDYIPGNWLYPSGFALSPGKYAYNTATVSLDKNMNLVGTYNLGKPGNSPKLIERTAPLTLGPGIFQRPYGAWARMATSAGPTSGNFNTILVPTQDIHDLGLQILNKSSSHPPPPYAFRMEMLGDLIVDCGHVPFKTEIHPPVAIALHLAGHPRTRYSLWGWHRSGPDRGPIDTDLWPDDPRPTATAQLKMHIVFNGGIGSGAGKWYCTPAPSDVPTHLHCHLPASDPTNADGCKQNPRMRPDCASDVAGGLVEVYWQ